MEEIGFDNVQLDRFRENGNNPEMTMAIVKHFSHLLESPEQKRLLDRLKEIRNKKLAHNEITSTTPHSLAETLDIVTFRDLAGILEISKHFIRPIGWAYMNTVFLHDGRYHLSDDAQRPIYSFNNRSMSQVAALGAFHHQKVIMMCVLPMYTLKNTI